MADKPDTVESGEYDNYLEESNKPIEKSDLNEFMGKKVTAAEEDPDQWENHWMDMPEFEQENKGPYKRLILSFRNKEDYEEFAEKNGLNLTAKTKSSWYPALAKDANCLKRWI